MDLLFLRDEDQTEKDVRWVDFSGFFTVLCRSHLIPSIQIEHLSASFILSQIRLSHKVKQQAVPRPAFSQSLISGTSLILPSYEGSSIGPHHISSLSALSDAGMILLTTLAAKCSPVFLFSTIDRQTGTSIMVKLKEIASRRDLWSKAFRVNLLGVRMLRCFQHECRLRKHWESAAPFHCYSKTPLDGRICAQRAPGERGKGTPDFQNVKNRCEQCARTFVDFAEGTATELLDNSVAFVQNFLAFLEHD